jgi:hypothetical protein
MAGARLPLPGTHANSSTHTHTHVAPRHATRTAEFLRNNTAIYTAKGVEVVPIVDGCQTEGKIALHNSCIDKPTADNFTCAEQKSFLKCDFPFMVCVGCVVCGCGCCPWALVWCVVAQAWPGQCVRACVFACTWLPARAWAGLGWHRPPHTHHTPTRARAHRPPSPPHTHTPAHLYR